MHTRPVWVEISRRNLIDNYLGLCATLQQKLSARWHPGGSGGSALLAVTKANAYGHGLPICAPALIEAGAEWLGVTSVEEAVEARRLCPKAMILVLSGLWHGEADAILEHGLTPVVWESFHLDLLEAAAHRRRMPPRSLPVHVEVDTGMARQGLLTDDAAVAPFLQRFAGSSPLLLDGLATHFSSPEVLGGEETSLQVARFLKTTAEISSRGHKPKWIHAGSSASVLSGEQLREMEDAAAAIGARLMLRPGLALYGYPPRFKRATALGAPGGEASQTVLPVLHPVLEWKTRVVSLRTLKAGMPVGYSGTFRAARPSRLALLPLGYGDGLPRGLSNRGSVLIGGRRAPIAGRVSMDQTTVDVTEIEGVSLGDEVVILGAQGGAAGVQRISAWELADLIGTIPYEVLCGIAGRVPRIGVD